MLKSKHKSNRLGEESQSASPAVAEVSRNVVYYVTTAAPVFPMVALEGNNDHRMLQPIAKGTICLNV